MVEYKIHYFPAGGRAELIRLIFEVNGAKYSEEHPAWPDSKANMPFGQMPVLGITDAGKTTLLAQTGAIARYLADVFKMNPECKLQHALVDSISESWDDIFEAMVNIKYYMQEPEKTKASNEFVEKKLKPFIACHEKLIPANACNYNGGKLTLADLKAFRIIEAINSMWPNAFCASSAPSIWRIYEAIKNHPKIVEYKSSARCHKE